MYENDYDLSKLGTVLAISNQINRDMLDMLREQQERQMRMIWTSLAVVLIAVLLGTWCVFSFGFNTTISEGGIKYESTEESGKRLSP